MPQKLLFVKKSVKVHVLTEFSPFFSKDFFSKRVFGGTCEIDPIKLQGKMRLISLCTLTPCSNIIFPVLCLSVCQSSHLEV